MTTKTNFGKWTFDPKNGVLTFHDENIPTLRYDDSSTGLSHSAKILDLIYQIAEKTWAKPQDLYDLISGVQIYFWSRNVFRRN